MEVQESLLGVFKKMRPSQEGMDLLLLHINRLLQQPFPNSAHFMFALFDPIAEELGLNAVFIITGMM